MADGYIYILRNTLDGDPPTLKIGKTTGDPHMRKRELRTTGVVGHFALIEHFSVKDVDHAEGLVHKELYPWRMQSDREFFQIRARDAIEKIYKVLESAGLMTQTTTRAEQSPDPTLRTTKSTPQAQQYAPTVAVNSPPQGVGPQAEFIQQLWEKAGRDSTLSRFHKDGRPLRWKKPDEQHLQLPMPQNSFLGFRYPSKSRFGLIFTCTMDRSL